jgi:hypothetical protein
LKLINELLDFRKAESKGLKLNIVNSDIIQIINETISRFKPSATLKGTSFETEFPVNSFKADLDPEIFTKILSNLFTNALKHANKVIEVKLNAEVDKFELMVSNDGDVIPEQYSEKIFEPFFKLNPNNQGTGLGLSFVKSLVELHKGSIYYDKSIKDRTTFVLVFPVFQEDAIRFERNDTEEIILKDVMDVKEDSVAEQSGSMPIILSVEDNIDFQQFLSRQLSTKYKVLKSHNGVDALSVLSEENVDLIVCDIMMPVMDGLEFCKRVKEDI